ncbi:MAG TPA: exodeoxyribonuclease VII large subunit [Planctomycetaceae bacterium]|nr:exodeoxyribonuclease VII large subunit [Planctomycetaceae bacterium]
MEHYEARGDSQERPLSVSQVNWFIKQLLEEAMPNLWAEGEISDLSQPQSGHIYFTLKDDRSQIRAVIWRSTAQRLKFKLKDGMSVVCRGSVDVYPPRGSYQLNLNTIHPQGVGPLQLAFAQLHEKLSKEGLFDERNKRPLPEFPRRIGFVTSPSGAAIHDFLEAAQAQWPNFELLVIPARVQGEQAIRDLVLGIRRAQRIKPALDLLIVGRGGGSIEDLWAFNEEAVVREVANCALPTISAVGHEIDVTLCDLAADARALTPTQAAQVGLPNADKLRVWLEQSSQRIRQALHQRVAAARNRLEQWSAVGVLARPHDLHRMHRQRLDELKLHADRQIATLVNRRQEDLAAMAQNLEALSPLNVLARGYSITSLADSGTRLRSCEDVTLGQEIQTTLPDGIVTSQVTESSPKRSLPRQSLP